MRFPLDLQFKLFAISSQVWVRDGDNRLRYYVKQKAFKLREAVTVYADEGQSSTLFRIEADRILDVSARYRIEDAGGAEIGALKRQGMRSFWKAHYEIEQGGRPAFAIREENPWVKVLDGLFGSIPILSLLSGYLFHPAYVVSRGDGEQPLLRVVKQPALFEGRFRVESLAPGEAVPDLVVVALLMMLLIERSRG